jgi:predicted ATPase/class 3 adenylate cyclase
MSEAPTGTVTFLFTDIEGSTTRWEHHPEAMRAALASHDALLRAVMTAHGGFVFKVVGDAVYAAFAVAADAVSAAIAAQRAVAAEQWGEVGPLRVRMALHTGVAQSRDGDYFGPTLNRVARVLSTGYGGQVLLSAVTFELVRDALPPGVSVKDLGEHALKDLLRPEHVFQLTSPDLQSDFPALKSLSRHPHNLPMQPTPFIGREREVATVCALLRRPEVRLLTLTGPGGMGKTRLGLQVAAELADQFADGVFLVPLAPISDPDLVASAIIQTLGISDLSGQSPLMLLKAVLKDKQQLLLVDNFEQVITAAVLMAELLAVCSELTILVTSRVVLHLQAEHEFAVPPLSLPNLKHLPDLVFLSQYESVALFIQRAQAVKADFAITNANAPAVAGICARLDGMPLAIELAAARAKVFPPQALLLRLEQGLAVLTGGARDLPARHQTLRGAIAWSYDLLAPEEQQLFRRLSVFVNGCTWEATEQVCMAAGVLQGDILDGLASLLDKSLLRQKELAESEPRFWMLQTLREFGLESLASAGETQATCNAHALYYLRLSEEAEPHIKGSQQGMWLDRLEREHENLRAALHWLVEQEEAALALRLSAALWYFWYMRGYLSEGRRWLEITLGQRKMQERTSTRAKALCGLGQLILYQGDHTVSASLLEASVGLARELGDKKVLSRSLSYLAKVRVYQGDDAAARILGEESVALCREIGDKWDLAVSLNDLGCIVYKQGDDTTASDLFEETVLRIHQAGNRWGLSRPLANLGHLAWSKGNSTRATELYKESLAIGREMSDKLCIGFVLNMLGDIALSQNEDVRAAALFEESFSVVQELGSKELIGWSLTGLAAAKGGEELQEKVIQRFEIAWAQGHLITAEQALAAQGDAVVPKRLVEVPRRRPYRHPVGGFFENAQSE